jgi:GDP-4-dehydro-6-deoxy-D-mannose reductase
MTGTPCLLLTGGTGFVGRYLAPLLRTAHPNHRLVLLCRPNEVAAIDGWEPEIAEIADEKAIDRIVGRLGPSIVVHLAAQSSIAAALGAAEATWRTNFCGSLSLASALARHTAGGTFLFASTSEVYGRHLGNEPVDESVLPNPMNPYAASKLAAERMLADVLPAATRLIVTRAFNHSGPGQDERFVLPSFAAQIARIESGQTPARISVGNLEAMRDFLHVADVVDAYVRLIGLADRLEARAVVNIASGKAWKIADLLTMMRQMAKKPLDIFNDPARMRASDVPVALGNAARLKALTGWEPRYGIEDIIRGLLERARDDLQSRSTP